MSTPSAPQAAHPTKVEPQEAEALAAASVPIPALLVVDFDLQFGEFLA